MATLISMYGSDIGAHEEQYDWDSTAEIGFFRKVRGCFRLGRIQNEDITIEANIDSMEERIKGYRKRWKVYVDGMEESILQTRRKKRCWKTMEKTGRALM